MKEAEKKLTRRRFLETSSTAFVGGAVLGALSLDSLASSLSGAPDDWPRVNPEKQKQRLLSGWDHLINLERKGEVVVTVSSEGIKPAFLRL